ncbi:MAG: hypothetical protein K940chlam7_01597 [Chlamydiae bacterium]|nr:hypothetical protein [Chlamydiota bacterium]
MEKWRKIFSLALMSVALFTFVPGGVQARDNDSCCDPCYDPCDCGGFEVGVDFLWWKPCVGDLDYAAVKKDSKFKHKGICPDWEPGFRVYIGKADVCCGGGFGASYTCVSSKSSSSTKKDGEVVLGYGHPGFLTNKGRYDKGKGSYDVNYQEWDLLASYGSSNGECSQSSYYFGVAGINLDQEFKAEIRQNSPARIRNKWDSDYWGVGLRIGADYKRRICDCFSFFANGQASILAGESCAKSRFDSQDSNTNFDHKFTEEEVCRVVPGYHVGAGFSYDTCVCDWDFSFRVGYEFLSWHNIPSRRTYVSDEKIGDEIEAALSTSSNSQTFGFHGLFAGFQLSF